MLNTCLTVRAHSAGSHQGKGWEQFTDRVIEMVDRYGGANLGEKSGVSRGVVFLAWGAWAAKRVAKLSKVRACVRVGSRALHPPEEAAPRPLLFFLTHSSPPAPLYTQATLLFVRLLLSISQPSLHLHLSAFLSLSHQTIFFSPSSR